MGDFASDSRLGFQSDSNLANDCLVHVFLRDQVGGERRGKRLREEEAENRQRCDQPVLRGRELEHVTHVVRKKLEIQVCICTISPSLEHLGPTVCKELETICFRSTTTLYSSLRV